MRKLESLKRNKSIFFKNCLFVFVYINVFFVHSQSRFYSLSNQLREISGIECYKDTLFFAINDGGNGDFLFVLNKDFKILKKVTITNCKNYDWEDLAIDDEYLYIGDVGNNFNKRKKLKIGRVKIEDLIGLNKVEAEIMYISYSKQRDFPPNSKNLNFDSETLISDGHSLYIFSKNRTVPYSGFAYIYKFTFTPDSSQKLQHQDELLLGKSKWLFDSFTGGTYHKGYFYLLTYNKLLKLEIKESKFSLVDSKGFNFMKQRESLCCTNDGTFYIANEFHKWLGAQKIQKLKW